MTDIIERGVEVLKACSAPDEWDTESATSTVRQILELAAPVEFMHRVEYRTKESSEPWVRYFDVLRGQDVEKIRSTVRAFNEPKKSVNEYRLVRRPVGEWEEVEL